MTAAPPVALYVPHGAPRFALRPGAAGAALAGIASRPGRPRAIVAAQTGGHTPAARAHPTEEQLLPPYVALGAGGEEFTAERIHAGSDDHVLAMDAFSCANLQGAPA